MRRITALSLAVFILALASCRGSEQQGHIRIDGSSTVYPITEAVAEEFQKIERARVTIGAGGTGSGFAKLCRGEINFADASRPIKEIEVAACKAKNIDFIELPIAYDGIVVAVNVKATWINELSVEDLKRIYEPKASGKLMKWNQINPAWPNAEIHLFSPGIDSGTFDYFTSTIMGQEKASRGDVTSSEDDNVLVQGVATDPLALGYFGYAYYKENTDRLKAVKINGVLPSPKTILDGSYRPLSRPLLVYVAAGEGEHSPVSRFMHFYIDHAHELIEEVGFIPLEERVMTLVKKRFEQHKTGTLFSGAFAKGKTVEAILKNDS